MPQQSEQASTGMNAKPGDRLVVRGQHVGDADRDGEILEVHGSDGAPPYLVRWESDGHVGLVFPGPDSYIQHLAQSGKKAAAHR